jgi:uncharacterized protein YkwD
VLIDLFFIAIVVVAMIRGYRRGASREMIATLAWLFGIPIGFRIGGPLGERLLSDMAPFAARLAGGFAVLLIVTLMAGVVERALLGRGGAVDDADRFGGIAVGLAGGLLTAVLSAVLFGAATVNTGIGRAAADSLVVGAVASPDGMGLRIFEAATGEHLIIELIAFNQRYPAGALLDDGFRSLPTSTADEIAPDDQAAFAIFEMVNEARRAAGVPEVEWWTPLADVGEGYAREMALFGFFSHDSPRSGDLGDRLAAAGIGFRAAGENLALAPNPTATHRGLMNSQGHRENILRREFTHLGIGVIRTPLGLMVVQVFSA